MAGRRNFRTLTSSQQSGIKSKHINTHITTIPNTQYTSNQYTTHYSVHQNLVHNTTNPVKKEIISKRVSGKSVGDLNAEYDTAKLTISTIKKKREEEIKRAQVAKGICRLSSSRCNITEQVEASL